MNTTQVPLPHMVAFPLLPTIPHPSGLPFSFFSFPFMHLYFLLPFPLSFLLAFSFFPFSHPLELLSPSQMLSPALLEFIISLVSPSSVLPFPDLRHHQGLDDL